MKHCIKINFLDENVGSLLPREMVTGEDNPGLSTESVTGGRFVCIQQYL